MLTDVPYALMAANAYAVKSNVTSDKNAIPIPDGYVQFGEKKNDQTGFTARAYKGANETVIAYTGTTSEPDGASDWANGNLPAAFGTLAPQLIDAAKFYLDVRKQNPNATIKLTGHSLGGGLASLISVFFNEQAVTFDEAPFGNSAKSEAVVSGLKAELAEAGYTAAAGYSLSALTSYDAASSLTARQGNIRLVYLKDEALSLLQDPLKKALLAGAAGLVWLPLGLLATVPTPNIKGSEEVIDAKATNGNGWGVPLLFNGQPVDLHDIALLTAFLQSQQLLDASRANPEVLQKIFTSAIARLDPKGDKPRFLNLMVQQEQQGNASWSAFAGDVGRLKGEVGSGAIKAALVGLDLGILAGRIDTAAERYTLPATGAMNASATADGKRDLMIGGASDDTFSAADGADTLVGRGGVDTLDGGSGNDTLIGGTGNDILKGGTGYDRYLYQLGDGDDRIDDADGGTIEVFGNGSEYALGGIFVKQQGSDTWSGKVAGHNVTIRHGADWSVASDDGATFELTGASDPGAFHIKLVDDAQAQTPYDRTILGDLTPLDPLQKDDLGNVAVGNAPAPGRADALQDSVGNDDIRGLGGNDFIYSWRGGDDRIDGGDGDDWMVGGAGNDIVIGGAGRDILVEGDGDDKLYADGAVSVAAALAAQDAAPSGVQGEAFSGGAGDDLAVGGSGNDALLGGTGADILIGGAGDDTIDGDAMTGNIMRDWSVTRSVATDAAGVTRYQRTYNGFAGAYWPTAGGNDAIYAGAGADWVAAGYGDDYVDGGTGDDVLLGEGGNDDLFGGAGNDVISGDSADTPLAAQGDDYLDGEDGDDTLYGEGGADTLFGGIGNDKLYGGDGQDYLDGEDGDDTLLGGAGDDRLLGGAGADFLQGDSGTGAGDGNDYLDGGDGADTLLGEGGSDELHGGAGNDQIAGDNGGTDSSGQADTIFGEDGDDVIDAQGGDDIVSGGNGNDLIAGGQGNDLLMGDAGNDQLQGGEGADTLDGGADSDTLFGEAGNDTLRGGDGNDYLIGGAGDDVLDGGAGDDVYYYSLGDGRDRIVDSGGTDWLVLNGVTANQLVLGTGSLKLTLPDGGEIHLDDFDPDNPYAAGGIEYFQFGDGTVMSKAQLINTLGIHPVGTPNADVLSGTVLAETIDALAGDDVVTARGGDDTVYAGDGNDMVLAGDGNDVVYGGNGDDVLLGEAGNDTLYGEAGNDLLSGGAGIDSLRGGDGNDTYLFQAGDGQDTAIDALGLNAVALGAGLTLDAVAFGRLGNDLTVSIKNSSDRLTVQDWFTADSHFTGVTLGDGTFLDRAGVEAAMPKNQAPVLAPDGAAVGEDAVLTASGNVLLNDRDPEGRALSVTNPGSYAGTYGNLSLSANGAYSYALNNAGTAVQALAAGQVVTERFGYTASDNDPNGAMTASSDIVISITGANDAPITMPDQASVSEDGILTASGNVLANDRDIDAGTVLRVAAPGAFAGNYGSLTLAADGSYAYALNNAAAAVQSLGRNQQVTDHFAYAASDGIVNVASSLDVIVAGTNDAPVVAVALPDQAAAPNKAWSWTLPTGSFADIDQGDALSYGASLADGSALPSWLAFDAATLTFSGRVPKSVGGYLDIQVTATDRVAATGSTVGSLSAGDVFRLDFGGGAKGGGSKGNEGVGNGVDAPPPGHAFSFNDGPGAAPGHPGAQGGNGYRDGAVAPPRHAQAAPTKRDVLVQPDGRLREKSVDGGRHAEMAAGAGNAAAGNTRAAVGDPAAAPPPAAHVPTDNVGKAAAAAATLDAQPWDARPALPAFLDSSHWRACCEASAASAGGDAAAYFAKWVEMDLALSRALGDKGRHAALVDELGADIQHLGKASDGFLGTDVAFREDAFSLLAGNRQSLQTFRGLGQGVRKIA